MGGRRPAAEDGEILPSQCRSTRRPVFCETDDETHGPVKGVQLAPGSIPRIPCAGAEVTSQRVDEARLCFLRDRPPTGLCPSYGRIEESLGSRIIGFREAI